MKGNEKLIATLNDLLADELAAIGQYMVHSEMCADWGFEKLHLAIESQAKDEMLHAEWLIKRVLFLEGIPAITKHNPINIGKTVVDMVTVDQEAELGAIKSYNDGIQLAREVGDNATADLLTQILKMEEGHFDWAETQRMLIEQLGLQNYLANQA